MIIVHATVNPIKRGVILPFPFLNICFMLDVFLSSVCTCFLFLSSNLLNWEEREVAWCVDAKLKSQKKSEFSLRILGHDKTVPANTCPSLPRLPDETFWGEPPAFLIKLNGDERSLLRGPGRDWRWNLSWLDVLKQWTYDFTNRNSFAIIYEYLCAAQSKAGDKWVKVMLLLFCIVLPPTLWVEAGPGRVAKEAAARLAQQLRLLHLQPAVQVLCPRPSHPAKADLLWNCCGGSGD